MNYAGLSSQEGFPPLSLSHFCFLLHFNFTVFYFFFLILHLKPLSSGSRLPSAPPPKKKTKNHPPSCVPLRSYVSASCCTH